MTTTTPNLGFQNWFSTTLSSGITATDTVIYLNSLPTPSEGFLVIEPDSTTNREVIFYNSKGANFVTVPTTGDRGAGGTTAVSHSSGVTVQMNVVAEHLEALQDGTAIADNTFNPAQVIGSEEFITNYVASGCVWTADAAGSTRLASMTSGVVYINGERLTVAAVTGRTFTASKDVYVDLVDNGDGTAVPVYYDNTTNAASPSFGTTGGTMRIAIVVVGASSIAAAASINQGQHDRVLPIASSVPYSVTDSLGNIICNRTPNPVLIGYKQIIASDTTGGTAEADIAALAAPVIVPTGRKVKITVCAKPYNSSSVSGLYVNIKESTTVLQIGRVYAAAVNAPVTVTPEVILSPTAGLHTYKVSYSATAGGKAVEADATHPAFIKVELV